MSDVDVAKVIFDFDWMWLRGPEAAEDDHLMNACAGLFSAHYGRWGPTGSRPGESVRISPGHVRALLSSEQSHIVCAFDGAILVGYAVILRLVNDPGGPIAWIAQLVVEPNYRRARVATTLMFSAWQFSGFRAWGVVTANPYAVRALETATRRPCRRSLIVEHADALLTALRPHLTYLPEELMTTNGKPQPCVDTSFPLDLSEVPEMRKAAARGERPWGLGDLQVGTEWFAVTFSSQEPSVARGEYINQLLEGVDSIWIHAYEAMTLDGDHAWHRHGDAEVDWIISATGLEEGSRVLDAGCGDGRHASAFAQRGMEVTAVDISRRLTDRAESRQSDEGVEFEVRMADLRSDEELPAGPFDLVVCLYDVVGSSADEADDSAILRNLASRVASGGHLVLSVMNAASTLPLLPSEQLPEDETAFIRALEALPASRQMEQTGGVFDPNHIVFFNGTFYRKEQFDQATDLPPAEMVIRDRRFSEADVRHLVENSGLEVVRIVGVRAGAWTSPVEPSEVEGKELLVVARRS